jgi:hypothetical protein
MAHRSEKLMAQLCQVALALCCTVVDIVFRAQFGPRAGSPSAHHELWACLAAIPPTRPAGRVRYPACHTESWGPVHSRHH